MSRNSHFDPAKHNSYRLARITQKTTLARVAKGMKITPAHLNDIEHGRRRMTEDMQTKWNGVIEGMRGKK
jgi:plasmid maintenance system antidote protein VapI